MPFSSKPQWTTTQKYDAGAFCKKLMDMGVRKYLQAALCDAHCHYNVSPQDFWDVLCAQNRFRSLAGANEQRQYKGNPYDILDFQGYTKYLRYGAKGSIKKDGQKVINDYCNCFSNYFSLSAPQFKSYRFDVLPRAISARNQFSHPNEVGNDMIDPDKIAEIIDILEQQTAPMTRGDWCSHHPELQPLDDFWDAKKAEYHQKFGLPPVDFYELGKEILLVGEDMLSPAQQQNLRKAVRTSGLNADDRFVYGVDRSILKTILASILNASPENVQKLEQPEARKELLELAQKKKETREKVRKNVNNAPKVREWTLSDSRSLQVLRRESGQLVPLTPLFTEALSRNFKIIVDESFLLSMEGRSILTDFLLPSLEKFHQKLYVDESVVSTLFREFRESRAYTESQLAELDPESRDEMDRYRRDLHATYKKAIKALLYAKEHRCLEVVESPTDSVFSYVNIRTAAQLASTSAFIVLTMDKQLAKELSLVNSQNAVAAKPTLDMELMFFGDTFPLYQQMINSANGVNGGRQTPQQSSENLPKSGDLVLVNVDSDPYELRLGKLLGEGGEGSIYETNSMAGEVAKIYHSDKLTDERKKKLSAMVTSDPKIKGLCWPNALIFNKQNQWVGCLMPRAQGEELAATVFHAGLGCRNLTEKMGWDRRSLALIAENVAATFVKMHRNGILMGDINPRNFMADKNCNVYLVDCDSYQFGGYRCPVGTDLYTPPEIHIQKKRGLLKDNSYIRTEQNERYSLAVLLFEIIMLGKAPYVSRSNNAQDVVDAIIAGDFPYPFAGQVKGGDRMAAPVGSWRYIWSNTPYAVKQAFYQVFANEDGERPSAGRWEHIMSEYRSKIESGIETSELIPKGYKDISADSDEATPMVSAECEWCHCTFTIAENILANKKRRGDPILCSAHDDFRRTWQNKPHWVKCSACGKKYKGSVREWYEQGALDIKCYCPDCATVVLTCKDCGSPFSVDREKAEALNAEGKDPLCSDCLPLVQCDECGSTFRIRRKLLERMQRMGQPVLCKNCRTNNNES